SSQPTLVTGGTIQGGAGNDVFEVNGPVTANLLGGAGNSTFKFSDGAVLTGSIDGGGGLHDQLDLSAYTTARRVRLTAVEAALPEGLIDFLPSSLSPDINKFLLSLVSGIQDLASALTGLGLGNGFSGTEAAISGGFSNINSLVANKGKGSSLTGIDGTAYWL